MVLRKYEAFNTQDTFPNAFTSSIVLSKADESVLIIDGDAGEEFQKLIVGNRGKDTAVPYILLNSNQTEPDTRMFLRLNDTCQQPDIQKVVISPTDTDVTILSIAYASQYSLKLHVHSCTSRK
ncbi:unnamed protein product [Didymodactylos carnosus]|uniref:Uncharacterized protein n=1 Tax=Didymodactylos carnosus TaxID=1234261 RepID=A0A813VM88_9BILA|nr:unnamed protein product [Didymodactylos carnosus]CAF3626890.1 unnamed protein product [Didymodactylos carnosus]